MSVDLRIQPPESVLAPINIKSNEIIPIEMPNPENTSEIKKIYNELEILQFQLETNKKRDERMCKEVMNSLAKIETVGFDGLLASLYYGEAQVSDVISFVENCTKMRLRLFPSGNKLDSSLMEKYSVELFEMIQKSISQVQRCKEKRIDSGKRYGEILSFINDQKSLIEAEIPRQSFMYPPRVVSRMDSVNNQIETQKINAEFINWMKKALTVTSESNSDTALLRSLICSISNRSNSIFELQKKIQLIKQDIVKPHLIDYKMVGLESLLSSPFMKSARSNYRFLSQTLENIQVYNTKLIPSCRQAISKCEVTIKQLRERGEKIKNDLQNHSSQMRMSLSRRQGEVADLKHDLEHFFAILNGSTDESIPELYKKNEELNNSLDLKLVDMISHSSGDKLSEFMAEKDLLNQIRNIRGEIMQLSATNNNAIKSAAYVESALYKIIFDIHKCEEQVRLCNREIEQLNKFEKLLQEFNDLIKLSEANTWVSELESIKSSFDEIDKQTNELQSLISPLIEREDSVNGYCYEIDDMQKRIDELTQERNSLDQQEEQLEIEFSDVSEELFSIIQELEVLQKTSVDSRSMMQEKKIQKYQTYVLCPICKQQRRDVILAKCLHPICRQCAEKAGKKCPVCGVSFSSEDIRPFYMQ